MTDVQKLKLLLDYNEFVNNCVSNKELTKETIREYLKGNYCHEPIKLK